MQQSKIMSFFRAIRLDSVAWSLRRIHCPVNKNDLVLEVGSGGSPYARSNILCDPYEETWERHHAPLIKDRPLIRAFAEELPFKNNSFDFLIASHVLEHSSNPEKFLSEIQRVAKAGYIEVPDGFMERLTAYPYHKLEITKHDNQLIIRKKKSVIQDNEIVSLFRHKAQNIFPFWAKKFPFHFHVRYYWSKKTGGINYKILNPNTNIDWSEDEVSTENYLSGKKNIIEICKKIFLQIHRYFFSQNKVNRKLNILTFLKCPTCKSESFEKVQNEVICSSCNNKYFYTSKH